MGISGLENAPTPQNAVNLGRTGATKRTLDQSLVDEFDTEMLMMPLGSGREVGRSCHLLKYKGKQILFDCGIHPGYHGQGALPFFDEIDPASVDVLLLTHFHVDHAASLPYFTEKTTFKGRVFMTHPTKAVMKVMLSDYMKVSQIGDNDLLYNDKDLESCMAKVELLDFHQECEVAGIRFWAYQAGHVLGAAMFAVEIAGIRVLYTGDYSRGEDRHLKAAEIPDFSPEVLIVESTYGIQVHEKQPEREKRLLEIVERIVRRKGRCLMPIWALGRAQELCLILDEYWEANPNLQSIPIYYASKLANKALRVYETYTNMMNNRIRRRADMHGNPFAFQHISNLKSLNEFEDVGACVVMASPGMLQSGISRQLLERWASNERNGVVLAGYNTQGTLAHKLIDEPKEITALSGQILQRKCSIDVVSFSAHADFLETKDFVEKLKPRHVILVHGDPNVMSRLKNKFARMYKQQIKEGTFNVHNPQNGTPGKISMHFDRSRLATAVGSLAKRAKHFHNTLLNSTKNSDTMTVTSAPQRVGGFLVSRDFKLQLLDAEDICSHTELSIGMVRQRQHVTFYHSLDSLIMLLERMFEAIDEVKTPLNPREFDTAGNIIPLDPLDEKSSDDSKKKNVKGKKKSNTSKSDAENATKTTTAAFKAAKAASEERQRGQIDGDIQSYRVCDTVTVTWYGKLRRITLEWNSGPVADMVADSIVSMAMLAQSSVAGLRMATEMNVKSQVAPSTDKKTSGKKRVSSLSSDSPKLKNNTSVGSEASTAGDDDEFNMIKNLLRSQFGREAVEVNSKTRLIVVNVDGRRAEIDERNKAVTGDPELSTTIKSVLRRVQSAMYPVISI